VVPPAVAADPAALVGAKRGQPGWGVRWGGLGSRTLDVYTELLGGISHRWLGITAVWLFRVSGKKSNSRVTIVLRTMTPVVGRIVSHFNFGSGGDL
jgi:hypothetical protein